MKDSTTNKTFITLLIVIAVFLLLIFFIDIIDFLPHKKGHRGMMVNPGHIDTTSLWMGFMAILSTLFAVFFVYTGFRIEGSRSQIDESLRAMKEQQESMHKEMGTIQKRSDEEVEYANQLQYAMSFVLTRQYTKAIDAFAVLRNEVFVIKDGRKVNTCDFMLANCFYEKFKEEDNSEDVAKAVEYINEAISDDNHPFKKEILDTFNKTIS